MKPLGLCFLSLYAGLLMGQQPSGIVCRNSDGFAIESLGRYLPQDQFNRDNLSSYFKQYITASHPGELTVFVTCDLDYYQTMNSRRVFPFYMDKGFDRDVIDIPGPVASFHRIGNNAFFEYRDVSGKSEWVVLSGTNVLSPSIKGTAVKYLGEYLFRRGGEESCVDQRRHLRLVVPTLRQLDGPAVISILSHYDSLLQYPGNMDIRIYESFKQAASEREFSFPSLEALAGGYGGPAEAIGSIVYYFRDRLTDGKYKRRMHIKDGERTIHFEKLDFPQ